jgi:hypothetical protein
VTPPSCCRRRKKDYIHNLKVHLKCIIERNRWREVGVFGEKSKGKARKTIGRVEENR